MNKKLFYIANWKMHWTFDETIKFATRHYDALVQLADNQSRNIILCPSYPTLYPLVEMFKSTGVSLGAQDCSDHTIGAFTGQISAPHLKSVGCSYCIVGHSERRRYNHEASSVIAQKCLQLITANIVPILCIGETEEQQRAGKTLAVLEEQLGTVTKVLHEQGNRVSNQPFFVAYEPAWAIGTNTIPTQEHLETVYAWLTQATQHQAPHFAWHFLYGGSVNSKIVKGILSTASIDGLLIGGASLDFQEFEKIVKYDN
jgi:triosephosphate isomerase (TIM)